MSVFNVFVQSVNAVSYLYLCYIFYRIFFERKANKSVTAVYFAVATCAATCSLLFLRGTMWNFLAIILIGFSMTFIFECKILYKLIFWALIYGIQTICEIFTGSLISSFYGTYTAISDGPMFVMGMTFSKFLIFLFILFIRIKKQKGLNVYLNKNNWGLFLLPFGTLVTYTLHVIMVFENLNQSKIVLYMTIISCTILGFSNIILFDFIDSLYKNTVNESRVSAANEIIANQTQQYRALIEHNTDILKIQHDNKNFCIGLISDLEEGRVETAIEKLKKSHAISVEEQRIHGNIISFLVEVKSKEAEKKGISISFDAEKLPSINIPATDLAIILGNALDNAIEAAAKAEGEKTVELFVTLRKENVVIVINNPIWGKVDPKALTTTKQDSKKHGFGILSMKHIAEKYAGEVMFSSENGIFTTSIIMNNNCNE